MAEKFECNQLGDSNVMTVFLESDRIFLNPVYQRTGEIWSLGKKQLLIDSLINGFDIPKIYFHEYEKAEKHDGHLYKYAIIDGKQRLTAIWDFMRGKFPLDEEFEYLKDPKIKLGGLKYDDLAREHATIHARFAARTLTIMAVRTSDTELIEDMFSRLNEAVPLNAAEKRNAFGGPLTPVIRRLSQTAFFTKKIVVSLTRYRHYDIACKFLYLEDKGKPVETKKSTLDAFVKDYAKLGLKKKAEELLARTTETLELMNGTFKDRDPLLKSPTVSVIYFLLFMQVKLDDVSPRDLGVTRPHMLKFNEMLAENRKLAEEDIDEADAELLEYERLSQSPNDASAIEYRLKVLRKYLQSYRTVRKGSK
jgi:uncharacterized protein DUF262